MRLILLADPGPPRRALQKLLGGTGHRLECHALDELAACDFATCDMVLMDGNARGCAAQARLLDAAQQLRWRTPRTPILILSSLEAVTGSPGTRGACGITASGNGAWKMHCRLKELAWSETEALLRETLSRDQPEPVVFEYRG